MDGETGRRRLVWGMLVVLSYSRHSFLWPLFGQQLSDIIEVPVNFAHLFLVLAGILTVRVGQPDIQHELKHDFSVVLWWLHVIFIVAVAYVVIDIIGSTSLDSIFFLQPDGIHRKIASGIRS